MFGSVYFAPVYFAPVYFPGIAGSVAPPPPPVSIVRIGLIGQRRDVLALTGQQEGE